MPRTTDLHDVTVVLTRAREDNAALAAALRDRDARVLELPCVRTAALPDDTALRATIHGLYASDVLVLTSRAGAGAVEAVMPRGGLACGVAVVGAATADRARSAGMRVTFTPSRPDGRTLGQELPLPAGRVVLARSDRAAPDLPAVLRARGARVLEVTAYRTVAVTPGDVPEVTTAFRSGRAVVVVASPSAVDALAGSIHADALTRGRFVALGPRTAGRVHKRFRMATVTVAAAPDRVADAIGTPEEAVP